jgi:hypothetical protein
MKKVFEKIVEIHWYLFLYSALYFVVSLPFVVLYYVTRSYYYGMQDKNYKGQTRKEEEEETKKAFWQPPYHNDWGNF